jgi:hypothetical protein
MEFFLRCLLLFGSLFYSFEECNAQFQLSVPFSSGFVGDNTSQNESSNSKYMSTLGWSNFQFVQNSSATTFVSQGNDIVGNVLITDNNGVEHTIPGFIKWRAPSGTVTALVFSPSSTLTLATNGSNGSSTYSISASKYIGLIFNGQSLAIPGNEVVKGNAATQGLLSELNSYLGSFPYLTVPDYTIYESAGKVVVTLTLSAPSSSTITVNFNTSDSTALSTTDYTVRSGSVSFLPGQLSKTIEITITKDLIVESTERLKFTISDAINASIQRGISVITILDDSPLGVQLVLLNANCNDSGVHIYWQTANEHLSDYFVLQGLDEYHDWIDLEEVPAAGESNELLSYEVVLQTSRQVSIFRLIQYDYNGTSTLYGPLSLSCENQQSEIGLYPNPSNGNFSLYITRTKGLVIGTCSVVSVNGFVLLNQEITLKNGSNIFPIELNGVEPGIYYLRTTIDHKSTVKPVVIQ